MVYCSQSEPVRVQGGNHLPDSQPKVFISSTYRELIEYRRATIDAVWRADMYPLGMERQDIALPITTVEASRRMIEDAHIFLLLISQRFGEITALEYKWALERKLPILAFVAPSALNEYDQEADLAKAEQLRDLKKTIHHRHTVASFSSVHELSGKVYQSLIDL